MLDEELKRLVEGLVDQNKEYRYGFKALLVLSKRYGHKSRNKTRGGSVEDDDGCDGARDSKGE